MVCVRDTNDKKKSFEDGLVCVRDMAKNQHQHDQFSLTSCGFGRFSSRCSMVQDPRYIEMSVQMMTRMIKIYTL